MIPIISYGTEKKHGESIKQLKRSCETFGYPHRLVTIPDEFFIEDRFKYLYKPTWIREMLEELKTPVIWMDADSYLTGVPALDGIDFDEVDFGYVRSPAGSHKWIADSCHVHTLSNIPFLRQWEAYCLEEKGISDHTQLIRTLDLFMKKGFNTFDVSTCFKGCYIRNYKTYEEIQY